MGHAKKTDERREGLRGRGMVGGWALLVSVACGAALGCSGASGGGESTGNNHEAIQIGYVGLFESQTNYDVNLLTANSQSTVRARSTGALREFGQPGFDQATCGVSFITHHFAVTAGHCVNTLPLNSRIVVLQYDTTHYDISFNSTVQARVSGTWNGTGEQFDQYFRASPAGPANGYNVSGLFCSVYARCDGSTSMNNCASVFNSSPQDLAILQCSNRASAEHVTVASSNPPTGTNIEIRWFHEILYLATDTQSFHLYQPDDNYQHYFLRDGNNLNNNYHYHYNTAIDGPQQLFPLLSIHDKHNSPYKITSQGSVDWTDAPVCHGTSGSGYFIANTDTFLGPCLLGSSGVVNNLCDDFTNDLADGSARSGYLDPVYTSAELSALPFDP